MKNVLCLFGALLLSTVMAFSARADIPVIDISVTDEAMVLDGMANENAWKNAAAVGDFKLLAKDEDPIEKTHCRLLTDGNGIWMFWECEDASIKSSFREQDDSTWHDDCVEIFFSTAPDVSPDPNIREFYQIIVNPEGCIYDSFSRGGIGDSKWSSLVKTKTLKMEKGWNLEMYVPFAAFPNCNLNEWRFLCARENWGKKYSLSCFPKALKFQEMDDYARLRGLNIDAVRFGNELLSFNIDTELGGEKNRSFIVGEIKTSLTGTLNVKCRVTEGGKKHVDFTGDSVMVKDGKLKFKLPVNIEKSGNYKFDFYLLDSKGLVFTANDTKSVVIAPCTVETLWPYYRDNIYPAMKDKTARFRISPMVTTDVFKECRIEAEVVSGNGKVIVKKRTLKNAELDEWKVPLDKVEPGLVTAKFWMYRGDKLLGEFEKYINILPPNAGGNEIWQDENRCLVINGSKFYPNGFFGCGNASLDIIAQAGGNVAHSYVLNMSQLPRIIEFLNAAQAKNIKVVLKPYYRYNINFWGFKIKGKQSAVFNEEAQTLTKELIDGIKNHPAFLGWYLYDEPRGAEYTRNLKVVYEFLRKNDPYHPVFGCDNSAGGCIGKVGHCDVHWVDIYPSPLLKPADYLSISIVSLYNQLKSVVDKVGREGVHYVPQAFERNSFAKKPENYRSMTYREIRASVFAGITAGVRGTVPYKIGDPSKGFNVLFPNAGIFSNPHMRIGYLKGILPELKALEDRLMAPLSEKQAVVSHDDVKQITFDYNGAKYVFLLNLKNEKPGNVAVTWPGKNVKKVKVLGGNGKPEIKDGKVVLNFAEYDAFVLTDEANAPATIDVKAVEAEIEKSLAEL